MGWFSPVKGHYPSLAQVDKTLPIAEGAASTKIERGMILALTPDQNHKDGAWTVATGSTDPKLLYIALQDSTDPTAGFAGDAFNPDPKLSNGEGTACITGLDMNQDGEYETTVFAAGDYAVGDALYVADGMLTKAAGSHIVGYVTMGNTDRWINNAIAVPKDGTDPRLAIRTGATKTVIRFKTAV